jgi:hypothetical protein
MNDDDIYRLILQNQLAIMNEVSWVSWFYTDFSRFGDSKYTRKAHATREAFINRQCARTEEVLARTEYLDRRIEEKL